MSAGLIGVEISHIFYNAMLRYIAPKGYLGRVSGWSWGAGYFGILCALIIVMILFVNGHISWLDHKNAENIRIIGPFVAIWYVVFAIPMFLFTKDLPSKGVGYFIAIRVGVRQLQSTIVIVRQQKSILKFLLSRMLYVDAINTVFAFGGIYAAGTFNMSLSEITFYGLAMTIAAGVGALMFSWLDDYFGSRTTVMIALAVIFVATLLMLCAEKRIMLWVCGICLSLCVGPAQSASRSLLVQLSPPESITEMFGLYSLSGKATSFLGPWLVGMLTVIFKTQRAGLSVVLILLALGGILLLRVPRLITVEPTVDTLV